MSQVLNSNLQAITDTLSGYQVQLRAVQEQDLELLRHWRNLPEVSQYMLSQAVISEEQQRAWFKKIQRDPSQKHYIISYKGSDIGSVNIKARGTERSLTSAKIIEPGLYIAAPKYRNNIIAFAPTLLINDYCFDHLGCESLRAVVNASNEAALNYNQKLGYKRVSEGELIEIALTPQAYQQHTKTIKALLSRGSNKQRKRETRDE